MLLEHFNESSDETDIIEFPIVVFMCLSSLSIIIKENKHNDNQLFPCSQIHRGRPQSKCCSVTFPNLNINFSEIVRLYVSCVSKIKLILPTPWIDSNIIVSLQVIQGPEKQ
uniref:Uncharacterized protein n=1 Tax=Glossina brevipalpis TaxID=37001 RepID=A0A1A9WZ68_9MUSC